VEISIDGGDLFNPMEEQNPALDESSGHWKPRPNCSLGAGWFDAKIMPPKATRRMSGMVHTSYQQEQEIYV